MLHPGQMVEVEAAATLWVALHSRHATRRGGSLVMAPAVVRAAERVAALAVRWASCSLEPARCRGMAGGREALAGLGAGTAVVLPRARSMSPPSRPRAAGAWPSLT